MRDFFHRGDRVLGDGHLPRRTEDVDGLGKDVVVDEAGVDGEDGHEEDQVPAAEEDLPDLGADPFFLQLLLTKDHPDGEAQHDETVTSVTKHHPCQTKRTYTRMIGH